MFTKKEGSHMKTSSKLYFVLGALATIGTMTLVYCAIQDTDKSPKEILEDSKKLLKKAIDKKACNAILIKPNQIGTLSETIKAVKLAKENGFNTIISHRSGETEDTSIAHLAIGLGAGQIKTGSLSRTDRVSKYNQTWR